MTLFVTNLNTGVKTKIFALFDTGSDREFLAGTAARQIDLKTHTKLTEVTTLRGPEVKETQMANFRIESLDGTYVCDVNDAIVDNLPVGLARCCAYQESMVCRLLKFDSKVKECLRVCCDVQQCASLFVS